MIYFDDEEVKVLQRMIVDCYDCHFDYEDVIIPPEYTELLGVLNFKIDCGEIKNRLYSNDDTEDGVAE